MQLANNIFIPFFKIFGHDGTKLKNFIDNTNPPPIYLKVDMSLANPDNRVEYELWYSSILDLT